MTIDWENIISVQEAVELSGRAKSTLINNVKNGIFKEGIDCKKIGNSWAFDRKAIIEYYNIKEDLEMTKRYKEMDMDGLLRLNKETLTSEEAEQIEENVLTVWFEYMEDEYEPNKYKEGYFTLAYPEDNEPENYKIKVRVKL